MYPGIWDISYFFSPPFIGGDNSECQPDSVPGLANGQAKKRSMKHWVYFYDLEALGGKTYNLSDGERTPIFGSIWSEMPPQEALG